MPSVIPLEEEQFYGAIGRLTISWAHLELGIDISVMMIHHFLNGQTITREAPRSLQPKLKYLRKAARELPQFSLYQTYIGDLATAIEAASEKRHDIIHGFIVSHEVASGEAKMIRLLRTRYTLEQKTIEVDTNQVLEATILINDLAFRTLVVSCRGAYGDGS
jgi:hypothetical protein